MHTNTTHNNHPIVDDVYEPHTQPSVCIAFVTTYTRWVAMPEVLATMERLVPQPGCGLLHADKAKARSLRFDHIATCIHSHNRSTAALRHHAHPTHRMCIIHTCIPASPQSSGHRRLRPMIKCLTAGRRAIAPSQWMCTPPSHRGNCCSYDRLSYYH